MREVGIKEIKTNISRRKNTVAQYIATCPILDLYLETKKRPVSWTLVMWW